MAIRFKNRKNKILALLMAMMMTSSFAALAACKDEPSDSTPNDSTSGSTATQTDSSRIKNGSFEFVNWNDGKNLIVTSPTGWSRSTNSSSSGTAVSSKSASGILNTEEEAWKNFTESSLPDGVSAPTTAEDAAKYWDEMSAYDKLKFYKAWDDADYDEKVSEQDFYDSAKDNFNVDIDDVPVDQFGHIIQNPGTHTQDSEDKDTNVLMIHNAYTDGQGTAQKFTSSSTITLQSGTSAKVSLWVKTSNLTYFSSGTDKQEEVVADKGAYIGITHTVGGKTLDQMQVKNINTAKMTNTDNGWVQYTFYLQGCSFASSTFTMVLGLGQTGGTNRLEYVEGYAFFDDVECTIISNEDYENAVDASVPEVTLETSADEKLFLADKTSFGKTTFALNMTHGAANFAEYALPALNIGLTEEKKGLNTYYVAADDGNLNDPADTNNYDESKPIRKVERNLNFDITADAGNNGVFSVAELLTKAESGNDYIKAALASGFGYKYDKTANAGSFTKFPFADTAKTLMLLSTSGANYTAKGVEFTLNAGKQMVLSFFVKTSDMQGVTGANVNVRSGGGILSSISTIDTTNITTIDVDGDDGKDIYAGWQQCFLFVENPTETDGLKFSVEFSYGGATVFGASKDSFIEGWAAFTNFEIVSDMGEAYEYASSETYSKTLSLKDPNEVEYSSSAFDTPAYLTGQEEIENGIADPRNYIGVKGGSGYVKNDPTADRTKYSSDTAGLISKKYIANYATNGSIMGITSEAELNTLFGNATQPLLIYNKEDSAYGFIASTSSTISGYTEISVRVKVSGTNAVANVYLIDMDDSSRENALSISRRISYWYDENGNVCNVDPTSDDFDKKTDIVLQLQSNGLYTAKGQTGYFANLQAYPQYIADAAERLENGENLLVAEGGVEYAYTNAWNGEGLDGVAYYYANGKYYADAAKTVEVKDFSAITSLKPRYEAVGGKNLAVSVGDTNGEWKTVTFYVGAGATAKNYRLEVWSGSRDGKTTNPAGSYVMFDTCQADTLDAATFGDLAQDAFDYLLETKTDEDGNLYADEDALKKALKKDGKLMYNAYSFYDDAKFLRYNSELDENKVGNSYDDYDSTAADYAETLSYLYYENADYNLIKVFADFSQNDKNVPVDVVEDEEEPVKPDDETTEDETNWGLLISSLAVAGVLVAVLVLIGVRKAIKWSRKKAAQLSKPTRVKPVKAKKEKPAVEETKDENDPYNN